MLMACTKIFPIKFISSQTLVWFILKASIQTMADENVACLHAPTIRILCIISIQAPHKYN